MKSRAKGVQDNEAGLATRMIFWFVKRHLKRVSTGMRVRALDPKLLRISAKLDIYNASKGLVTMPLKELAQLKVATMVGCPF
jgi:hypothetical protein